MPGYHFSADGDGCATIIALLGELQKGRSLKRPMPLAEVTPRAFADNRLPITGNGNVLGFETLDLA